MSNAAVLLFGGIETTEGMIANAALAAAHARTSSRASASDPQLLDAAIEESLRLEPAAAVSTATRPATWSSTASRSRAGDLVRVSIAGANRDPAVFAVPGSFDLDRPNSGRHLAFAHGPHVCVGVHLARLEAQDRARDLLGRLPGLRLDPDRPSEVRGLVFRKPSALHVVW